MARENARTAVCGLVPNRPFGVTNGAESRRFPISIRF
jgi:hypothetical protein